MSTSSLNATDPNLNATVSASAGSGKTWLLVTRLVRLLLEGHAPGNILALTFTRKAAAEMNIRLHERLYQLATADNQTLEDLLQEAGIDITESILNRSRVLYEEVLYADFPIRLLTFHAFCQEVLAKFTLEADVPPGFELHEDTSLLEQQVWEALFTEATQHADSEITRQLKYLMLHCNGPATTRKALFDLLHHRNDWWAFTEHQNDVIRYASRQLASTLDITPGTEEHIEQFFNDVASDCKEFCELLAKHSTATNNKAVETINDALEASQSLSERLRILTGAFLTKSGTPFASKARQLTDTLRKKMGDTGAERFVELHHSISERLIACIDIDKRHQSYQLNVAWYTVGNRLIELYQNLKRELRVLDFTDLEWHCYKLLSDSDNAHWVQYKMDQRIDHILIDEFQDTNPTQWQLLYPLLDEMAASYTEEQTTTGVERSRSVFLVGDEKQSIYSFRRANPALQGQVSDWLRDRLNAQSTPLDHSWRSSPAIMQFVNAVFSQAEITAVMPGFTEHGTHHGELYGRVTLLPEFESDDAEDSNPAFRNPLLQPRVISHTNDREKEAICIAQQIEQLLAQKRIGHYCDIMLLLRNRTHLATYERVLHEHGIPFNSDQRGGLLDNLEIQDLECLLDVLITPFDNLALAQVLKSPIFAASDDDLKLLASCHQDRHWYQRLLLVATDFAAEHPLSRAATSLSNWHTLADTIPVHDLLDHIYAETHLIERYCQSVADDRQQQVAANLQRFIELSLEVDAGRYPSLSQFKHYLSSMREHAGDKLDQAERDNHIDRIQIMTIHGSKGLEAPVVFLADGNAGGNNKNAYQALVDWPEQANRPTRIQLQSDKANTDSNTLAAQQHKLALQQRENMNLLYVALTRARQYLYISAVAQEHNDPFSWYGLVRQAMQSLQHGSTDDGRLIYEFGSPEIVAEQPQTVTTKPTLIDEALLLPFNNQHAAQRLVAPSRVDMQHTQFATEETLHGDARLRGLMTHRALDLLSQQPARSQNEVSSILANEYQRTADDLLLLECIEEAQVNIGHQALQEIFSPADHIQARNEMPVLFKTGTGNDSASVYGIIDRVLIADNEIVLVDYKSHRLVNGEEPVQLAQQFLPQLDWYRKGVEQLWPGRPVRCGVLFTHHQNLIWL